MKKGLLQTLFISSIFLINLVSASFHYGYGRFSFRGFIDGFDPVTLSLGLLFIVFLLVLNNLVFINLFRDQKGVAFVVSASISLLAVYWMYQKGLYLDEAIIFPVLIASMAVIVISYILINGFKMNRAMSIIIAVAISGAIAFWAYTSNFSLPSDILFPIVSFLLALGVIILILKKKFTWFLIISGLLLILTATSDIFYEKGIALIAGIILLVIGLWLAWRNRGRGSGGGTRSLFSGGGPGGTTGGPPGVIRRGSQKAWSGTFARGRNMSVRRAEKAAYKEEARRQKERGRPEREAYKEDAKRQRNQQKGREKAEEEAYKEEARRQKEKKKAEEEAYKEDAKRQQDEQIQKQKEVFVKRENKLALARKLGISKLEKQYQKIYREFQEGIQNAGDLSSQATRLGWTKSGRTNPRQGESEKQYKTRVKEANKTYKTWYRQYSKNIADEKKLKEIQARIAHLQSKI